MITGQKVRVMNNLGFLAWRRVSPLRKCRVNSGWKSTAGHAQWEDLAAFLVKYGGAEPGPSTTRTSFVLRGQNVESEEEQLATVKFADGLYAVGEMSGIMAEGAVQQLGLNVPAVSQKLRDAFFPERAAGAAYLTRPSELADRLPRGSFGLLLFLRQTLRYAGERASEDRLSLHTYLISSQTSVPQELDRKSASDLIRRLQEATRIRDPQPAGVESEMEKLEPSIMHELRRPSDHDLKQRIRHAVWPVAAMVVI